MAQRVEAEPLIDPLPAKSFLTELDVTDTLEEERVLDLVINYLKKNKLYKQTLVYRGFEGFGNRLYLMRRYGTDFPRREFTYATTEKEWLESINNDTLVNPVFHAWGGFEAKNKKPCLAVYDSSFLISDVPQEYRGSRNDFQRALVGVFILK